MSATLSEDNPKFFGNYTREDLIAELENKCDHLKRANEIIRETRGREDRETMCEMIGILANVLQIVECGGEQPLSMLRAAQCYQDLLVAHKRARALYSRPETAAAEGGLQPHRPTDAGIRQDFVDEPPAPAAETAGGMAR